MILFAVRYECKLGSCRVLAKGAMNECMNAKTCQSATKCSKPGADFRRFHSGAPLPTAAAAAVCPIHARKRHFLFRPRVVRRYPYPARLNANVPLLTLPNPRVQLVVASSPGVVRQD